MGSCANRAEREVSPVAMAIAGFAARALREELAAYPKPGLVSHVDRGSHPDMDVRWFLVSIECLEPYLGRMAQAGAEGGSLLALQQIGIAAEEAMLAVTQGKNTHRGAIFCLGLLAAAAGRRAGGWFAPATSLGEIVVHCWGDDLVMPKDLPAVSDGIAMCHRHAISGARGEAKRGFPAVFKIGLPVLRGMLGHVPRVVAHIQVFFELFEGCEDTTLLKRGGEEGREFARAEVRGFLAQGGVLNPGWKSEAVRIHRAFVARGLTAGGVADLLAATLFVDYLENHR
jgi:triphosphoribosyl-dephospho-CoA synthase